MRFCGDVSYYINKGIFLQRPMQELLVDTMEVELLQGRCFAQGFGGPLFIMMQQIMRGAAMSVNSLGNHRDGMRCRLYPR